jgi:hypothetical protein
VQFEFVAVNGNGRAVSADENTHSIVVKISFGSLDAVVGGDLPAAPYNLEDAIAPLIGQVEIYKVHHHGSKDSSSDFLLSQIRPLVGTISVGQNSYGHPTVEALTRLASYGFDVYQTSFPSTKTRLGPIEINSVAGKTFDVRQGVTQKSYVSHGIDATPPTAPGSLFAADVTDTSVRLAWTASTDNVGVTGYRILRRDAWVTQTVEVARTRATEIVDVSLSAASVYRYFVTAVDAAGNESQASEIEVTTQMVLPVSAPERQPRGDSAGPGRPSRP